MILRSFLLVLTCVSFNSSERPGSSQVAKGESALTDSKEEEPLGGVSVRATGGFQSLSHKKSSPGVQHHRPASQDDSSEGTARSSLLQAQPDPSLTPRKAYLVSEKKPDLLNKSFGETADPSFKVGSPLTTADKKGETRKKDMLRTDYQKNIPAEWKSSGSYNTLENFLISKEKVILGKEPTPAMFAHLNADNNDQIMSISRYMKAGSDAFKKNKEYQTQLRKYVESLFHMSAGAHDITKKEFDEHVQNVNSINKELDKAKSINQDLQAKADSGVGYVKQG